MDKPKGSEKEQQSTADTPERREPAERFSGIDTPHRTTIGAGTASNSTTQNNPSAPQWNQFLRDMEWSDWITAGATVVIAILTGFYVHYARGQLIAIEGQLNEMKSSAGDSHALAVAARKQAQAAIDQVAQLEASIKETHVLADVARRAVTNAQENFRKDQAPIIWFEPELANFRLGERLFWNIILRNYGRSTAFKMRSCIGLRLGANILSRVRMPTFDTCTAPEPLTVSVMPPGASQYVTLDTPFGLNDGDIRNITQVIGSLVVVAVVEYEDVSGHLYRSRYCGYRTLGGGIAGCPNLESDITQIR